MEKLESYLKAEGWSRDWDQTKKDISGFYKSNNLDNQKGNAGLAVIASMAAMPVCAVAGTYFGEGMGYLWGNAVDFFPYIRDVAPWCAERAGLIIDAKDAVNLNEDLYQTAGAVSGFWGGLFLPIRIWTHSDD